MPSCKAPVLSLPAVIQSEQSGRWLDAYRSSCCIKRHGIWKSHLTRTGECGGARPQPCALAPHRALCPGWVVFHMQFPESFAVEVLLCHRFSPPGSKHISLSMFHRALRRIYLLGGIHERQTEKHFSSERNCLCLWSALLPCTAYNWAASVRHSRSKASIWGLFW